MYFVLIPADRSVITSRVIVGSKVTRRAGLERTNGIV